MNSDASVDKRQPHMLTPPKFVELQDLEKLGVLYHKVSRVRDFTCVIITYHGNTPVHIMLILKRPCNSYPTPSSYTFI